MSAQTPVYCVLRMLPQQQGQTLRDLEGVAVEVARNARYVVIGNRAALRLTPPQNR